MLAAEAGGEGIGVAGQQVHEGLSSSTCAGPGGVDPGGGDGAGGPKAASTGRLGRAATGEEGGGETIRVQR